MKALTTEQKEVIKQTYIRECIYNSNEINELKCLIEDLLNYDLKRLLEYREYVIDLIDTLEGEKI